MNFLFKILICACLISFFNDISGQNIVNVDIEKLKSELKNKNPNNQAKSMLSICYCFFSTSADSSLHYALKALKISKSIGNDTLIGRAYLMTGYSYLMLGHDSLSMLLMNKSAEIFQKINDSSNLANSLLALANYHSLKGNQELTLKYYFISLGIYRKMNKPETYDNVMSALNGIGYVYSIEKNYKEALKYYHYALKLAEIHKDDGGKVSEIYTSIGNVYMDWNELKKALNYYTRAYNINVKTGNKLNLAYNLFYLGEIYLELKSLDTAYFYLSNSAVLFTEMKETTGLSGTMQLIGNYFRDKKQYKTALRYYLSALKYSETKDEQQRIASLLFDIGQLYFYIGNLNNALSNCFKSLDLSLKTNYQEYILQNYKLLSDIYSMMDNCNQGYDYYKKYVIKKDSVYDINIHRQISEIQTKYETEKRQKEIEILKQKEELHASNIRREKIMRNSTIGFALLLIFIIVIVYNNYRHKRKANIIIASEKQKSDNLLLNILPEQTAEELKEKGYANTRYYEMVTVLFTDFAGFTSIAEKLSPEELVQELDYCFRAYDQIIEKYQVEKIKTIGDSYMCAGGLPKPNTTNANDVVMAGLEICRFMNDYKQERISEGRLYFEIRIGIHTGPVITGIVGTKKFAYDIWGDTVNTAARMESSGKPGFVNISGSTFQYVSDKFICTYRGKVEAKNKGEVDMYFVEGCSI